MVKPLAGEVLPPGPGVRGRKAREDEHGDNCRESDICGARRDAKTTLVLAIGLGTAEESAGRDDD